MAKTHRVHAKGNKIGVSIAQENGTTEFNLLHTLKFQLVDFRGKAMYSSDRYPKWRTKAEWLQDTRAIFDAMHNCVSQLNSEV